ncbi:hypothetical protein [Marinitenerispora sediminis]|uniref:Uncharacterized protein n=1 Tax=Marinitenerispora sediminis TaxID=1931232 RepID=A0A368T6P6_9ACTN|nr:hypothetical protein [Marinitenerispora sediminis]RCV53484.1 hypothetical protein DEF23_17550 [Marinitenerispora sediminis]RCV59312.1 hypothetical protein DEF24_10090 [Marinitenerispora sediminis]
MADALREVHGDARFHGLDVDLDITAARQGVGHRQPSGHVKASEAPIPVDLRATEARAVLRSTLVTWVRVILDDNHIDIHGPTCRRCTHWSCGQIRRSRPPADTLPAMARWLRDRATWIRHAPYGPECVDEIVAAVREVRRVVDRPTRRVPLHVTCTQITLNGDTPTPCGGDLYAVVADGLAAHGQIRCAADPGHVTTVTAWVAEEERAARRRGRLAAHLTSRVA